MIKGKQIANNTLTQNNFNITTASIVNATDVTTKEYVESKANSAVTSINFNTDNLNMTAIATTEGNGLVLACNTAILATPISVVKVTINSFEVNVGQTLDCAFSGDAGSTFRASGEEQAGDYLYWNTNVAPFQLETTDEIDFNYMIIQV
jgi:hypothetical protein